MAKVTERTLWVTSVQPREIDGHISTPTALCYLDGSDPLIGWDALVRQSESIVNSDFKLALGDIRPGSTVRAKFEVENGRELSANELTKDFIDTLLKEVEGDLPPKNPDTYKIPAKIIVAEPLSFQIDSKDVTWLKNYRENIRRILSRYEEIDFLPEPFAVYQYYRYGQRIPQLQQKTKHVALVIDFGGGTFDICLIESTNKGDIALTGKHSKPLAADSAPIGGFVVNFLIAKYLIKKNLDGANLKKADQFITAYSRVKKGELAYGSLNDEKKVFIDNFRRLEHKVERYKIDLVSIIRSWRLEIDAYDKIVVDVPLNPFSSSNWIKTEFFAHQLRSVFVNEIWEKSLKRVVSRVLKRASEELEGKQISITLISGGSSNLRWLSELIARDFEEELNGAEPVPINQSFQEIVANGLAIECARRFYDESSEFVSVTYNPIKLYLDPDDKGIVKDRRFSSVGDIIDMKNSKPGDLMPSAQSLNNFIDEPLQWRIKLPSPPKHHLNYYFSRPDNEEHTDCYNVDSKTVYTRDNKHFDAQLRVEIVVREDGTAIPKFIYKAGNEQFGVEENSETGKPFVLDMTTGNECNHVSSFYVGLDFGSSNSAVCTLTQDEVKLTTARQASKNWVELSEALPKLPYPASFAVRKYLDVKSQSQSASVAREAFEACLAFIAYTAAAELCSTSGLGTRLKSFQHRSMGPLKQLLEVSISGLKNDMYFSSTYEKLIGADKEKLDSAIRDFTNHKHEKIEDKDFDHHQHLLFIVNTLLDGMKDKKFGYCFSSETIPFQEGEYQGAFKVAHDNTPFIETLDYSSKQQNAREYSFLVDEVTGKALNLFPFVFWMDQQFDESSRVCYWLDKLTSDEGALVKPCNQKAVSTAISLNEHLDAAINKLKDDGSLGKFISSIFFKSQDLQDS